MNQPILTRPPRWLIPITSVILLLVILASFALFIRENWNALNYPYALDYGEGVVLDQTMRLSRFEAIYRNNLTTPPLIVSNYPPIYTLVQAPFAWAFGPALWYGRLISILSAIAAAVFCSLIVHSLTGDHRAGVISGALLLVFPCVIYWSGLNRIDSLALALSCAGMYAVVRAGHRGSGLLLAAALFTLSIYTRQSYALAAPAASFIWLFTQRMRRGAIGLAGATVTLTAGLLLALNTLTGGGFWLNIVSANVGIFDWSVVVSQFSRLLAYSPILVLCALAVCVSVAFGGEINRQKAWWLACPYLAGAIISGLTIGKEGSNVNYLFELAVALSLCGGIALAWIHNNQWLQAVYLAGITAQVIIMMNWTIVNYARNPAMLAATANVERLSQIIRAAPDPVLSDITVDLVVLNGHPLYYEPFARRQLIDAGLWNPAPFISDIRNRRFPLILLFRDMRESRWTPEMLDAVYTSYRLDQTIAGTNIYVPKQ
ncbi:MAG: glycosyltransferase family 39 protein [Chloroflexi bacterium]|nr:glycosyltransferase family 39 protein [Chloroflexota bacterium]MCL5274712.1 glycosyltransferase family 39 protein [Chloroflexota bacterium]